MNDSDGRTTDAGSVDACPALYRPRKAGQWEGSMTGWRRSADFDSIIVCTRFRGHKKFQFE
jgi:hypothetical protein